MVLNLGLQTYRNGQSRNLLTTQILIFFCCSTRLSFTVFDLLSIIFIKNDYSFQINFGAGSSLGVALGILSQTNYQQAHVVVDLGMETK